MQAIMVIRMKSANCAIINWIRRRRYSFCEYNKQNNISGTYSDLYEENVSEETIRMLEQINKLRENKLS